MKNDEIPIVFAVNENYVPYMSATIQSIMENAGATHTYKLFVLYRDITDKSQVLLTEQVAGYALFSIKFIEVTPYLLKYHLAGAHHWSVEIYFKFLIPYLFAEYDKVIWLDSDMICLTDIAELFAVDFDGGEWLAAARSLMTIGECYYHKAEKHFSVNVKTNRQIPFWNFIAKMKNCDHYFSCGTMVFNTKVFAQAFSSEQLWDLLLSKKWEVLDQDPLNDICEGKTLFLPNQWNFEIGNNWEEIHYLPDYLQEEREKAAKQPKILHFLCKPWTRFFHLDYFYEFWKYATRTPFIEVIIQRMQEQKRIGYDYYVKNNQ